MTEQKAITREEAIKRLKETRFTIQPYNYMNQALDMAISALENQIAEKVSNIHKSTDEEDRQFNGEETLYGYCPYCGELNNTLWNADCCGDCGKKLDWSEI